MLTVLNNAVECFDRRSVSAPAIDIDIRQIGRDVVVSVTDNAGGIAAEDVNKVFDLYFTTKIDGIGTGLGLYIAKLLIEKNMHGTITAANGRNGARFTIYLPAQDLQS